MKTVYTCFCTDIIHEGHLKIIEEAKKYGCGTVQITASDMGVLLYTANIFLGGKYRERSDSVLFAGR